MRWMKRLFRRHYEKHWDGWNTTCACGYSSNTDPFLSEHFRLEGDR